MARPRTGRSTIGRDPWDAVIPLPAAEPPEQPGEGRGPRKPRLTRRRAAQVSNTDEQVTEATAENNSAAAIEQPPTPPAVAAATPAPAPATAKPGARQKLTVHLDEGLVNRVKNAAYWNPRLTIARIAEEGIRLAIEKVEREHGGAYPQRESELIGGRPIK